MSYGLDHLPDHVFGRLLFHWVDGARRYAGWVLALALAATAAILVYTVDNLGMNTDTEDMISAELPFRQAVKDYDRAFPQFDDVLVVVIDAETPDLAEDAAAALAARLEQEQALFKTVYRPGSGEFFTVNGFLYLDLEELEDLADNLAEVQPLIAALARDPSLRRLFAELEFAIEALREGETPGIDPAEAFDRLSDAIDAAVEGRRHNLSWREMFSGETPTTADRRSLILVQPRLDFTVLQPQKEPMEAVRRLAADLGLVPEKGIRVRLTGSVALNYEQLQSAQKGAEIAAPVSFVLVAIVLFVGLRSLRLVLAALVTLLVGLIWTAGFATLAIGELNLVSVAFAVLFIGLGIDFSIHMCLRYSELIAHGRAPAEALVGASNEVGRALFLCAATTAAGFYVFIPTDYAGVSELGLISGTGMFISLVANVTILPALLELMPLRANAAGSYPGVARPVARLSGLSAPARRAVRVGALAAAVLAIALLPQIRFDFNPLNLHDPEAESVATLRDLLAESGTSPWSLKVLAASREEAEALAVRLEALDEVDGVVTIGDYVPENQDDKLALIEQTAFFMGRPPSRVLPPPEESERRAALGAFESALDEWLAEGGIEATLEPSMRRLAAAIDRLDEAGTPLDVLERSLLGSFPERLRQLHAALGPTEPVTFDDLPAALVERNVAADGRVRVQAFPRDDVSDNHALRRFVGAVRSVVPEVIGNPVSILESGDAVVGAFHQALASALAVIIVLLVVLMRRVSDTALVLAPLVLAAVLTGAASVVLDIPFNFANVIVLPLLLGIGVDSAIHLVHRHRTDPSGEGTVLRTSTARGVVFSALTTICSFGSLMLSTHRGMATMGALLTIGVGFTLVCTLVVLPALLRRRGHGVEQTPE